MKILLRHVALGALAALTASVLVGARIGNIGDVPGSVSGPAGELRSLAREQTLGPIGNASWDSFYAITRP